jgi:exopolysaccharide biosynthesis polyprenyl glycosylphosphotransferase
VHQQNLPRLTLAAAFALSIVLVTIARAATRACLRRWYANPHIAVPLVVMGFNNVGHYLMDQVLDGPSHYEPVGFLDPAPAAGREYRGLPLLGAPERLPELCKTWETLEVAIAMPGASHELQERVHWWIVPWMLHSLATGLKVDLFGAIPLIGPRRSNIAGLNYVLKRAFDVIVASVLLLLTGPVMALAALLIRLTDGSPVLFRQTRIGRHGKPFELLKLRTMHRDCSDNPHRDYVRQWIRNGAAAATSTRNDDAGGTLYKLAQDNRITPIGRILRRFSLDELPQLFNVWRGEMSLIGPRPALPYEIDHYTDDQRRRLEAVPGITGLWQVSGRNRLSFAEMVRLDLEYLEDWSLTGDLKILLRTVPTLLRGSGI